MGPSGGGLPGWRHLSLGADFVLTLFTSDPELARRADAAGIDRIGVDLERLGKEERQAGTGGWISDHEVEDLYPVRAALATAVPFARTNPLHRGSRAEIDQLADAGARAFMLPWFSTCNEVETFVELVGGRGVVSLLVESAAAAASISEIVRVSGVDEIHVGLNDLHLDLGLSNHFELLVSPLMSVLSDTVNGAGVPFGFGGVARLGDTALPVDADLVIAQYPRLSADRALVSRVFLDPDYRQLDLKTEVARVRERLDWWSRAPVDEIERAFDALRERAAHL